MDVAELEQAYRRYFPIIREKCTRMLRDPIEAQDVAQETFTRLWANRSNLKDPGAVPSWIYRTSTRITIDRYRTQGRIELTESPDDAVVSHNLHSPAPQLEARNILAALGSRVPRKELEIAILSRIDGMTHDEIAEVVGTSDRTIRRLLKRFDERVRCLQQEAVA